MGRQGDVRVLFGGSGDVDLLRQGFNRGFADYKYGAQFGPAAFAEFLDRSGVDPANCAVLVQEKNGQRQGIGAGLLALNGQEGWCGGLAVDPAWRGQGWGTRLMAHIQSRATAAGAVHMRLEVLVWNTAARELYRRLGYAEQRELLIWERDPRQGPLPLPFERLEEHDPAQILDDFYRWHELEMPWQRREASLRRHLDRCIGLTIPARDGAPVAYALVREMPGGDGQPPRMHIVDMAVDPAADLLDAGRPLVQALQLRALDALVTLVNEPADGRFNRILASFGFRVADRQQELWLALE